MTKTNPTRLLQQHSIKATLTLDPLAQFRAKEQLSHLLAPCRPGGGITIIKCQASPLSNNLSPHKGRVLAVFSVSASDTAEFLVMAFTKTLFSTALRRLLVVQPSL